MVGHVDAMYDCTVVVVEKQEKRVTQRNGTVTVMASSSCGTLFAGTEQR